nr:hypothetical protein [Desulfurococcales archaeon]
MSFSIGDYRVKALSEILHITLSTPVKPGSYHRFMPSADFEKRIVEVLVVEEFMKEGYRRG